MADDVNFKFGADLDDVKNKLNDLTDAVKGVGGIVKSILVLDVFEAIKSVFEGIIEVIKRGFEEVFDIIKESVEAASEHELVFTRLQLSIEHVRQGFAFSAEEIKNWSIQLEDATGQGHEGIERVAAQLARFNVSGGTFMDSIKAAMNVSAETGGSAEGEANKIGRALAMMEQGSSGGMRRLREELADLTEAEKKHIEELVKEGHGHEAVGLVIDEINRKYADAAEVVGTTLYGQMQKFHAVVHRVYEELGNSLLPTIKEMVPTFTEIAHHVEELAKSFAEWINKLAESGTGKAGIEGIKEGLKTLFAYVEEFFHRLPTYLDYLYEKFLEILDKVKKELFVQFTVLGHLPDRMGGAAFRGAAGAMNSSLDDSEVKHKMDMGRVEGKLRDFGTYEDAAKKRVDEMDAEEAKRMKAAGVTEAQMRQKLAMDSSTDTLMNWNWNPAFNTGGMAGQMFGMGAGGMNPMGMASGLGMGASFGLEASRDMFTEKNGVAILDDQMKSIRDQMHKDEHKEKPFKSAVDDALSIHRNAQIGALSDPDKKQDTLLKTQLEHLQVAKDRLTHSQAMEGRFQDFKDELFPILKEERKAKAGK